MQSKHLKPLLLLACVLLLALLALTACSGGSDEGGTDDPMCEHSWSEYNHEYSSCTEDEVAYYRCDLCGATKEQVLREAPGHTVVTEPGYASTCTVDGVSDREYCSVCGEDIKPAEFIPAPGHTVVDDIGYSATCTENGLTNGSHCSTCNVPIVEQQVIYAGGHADVFDKGYDATCTEDGLTDGWHCSVCGIPTVEQTVIQAYGHSETESGGYDATCTEDGLTAGTYCYVCGVPIDEQQVIPAPGHEYEFSAKLEPTCESSGHTASRYCKTCNIVFEVESTLPKVLHSFENGSCKWCSLTATGGLTYELNANGDGYVVTGIEGLDTTEITVPNTHEGKPVVAVAKNAFSGNTSITSITFTGNVTTLGEGAFSDCTALESVYLTESVTEVEANAFNGCTSLTNVECEDYSQIDGWSAECFGSSEIKIVSDYKDGKTPYEIYLEAMSMLTQKDNSFKSTYTNSVALKTLAGAVQQQASQTVYTELIGLDMYTSYSPSLQLNNIYSMSEFWYKGGVYYINRQSSNPSYLGGYLKQSVSPDYIRALSADLASAIPAPNEDTFKSAEFKRNADGSFTLTLTLDEQQIEDMCFELLEMMFGANANEFKEISHFTDCVFKYDFDANGKIAHTYVDANLYVEGMFSNGYTTEDGIATIDGDIAYSDVGTLTSLSKNTPSNYYDADTTSCYHSSSYQVTVPGFAATCTENGLTDGVYCSNCMQAVTLSQTIYATGHTTEQGLCEDCGEFIGRATDFDVIYNEDGKTAILVGRGDNTDRELVIPESIYGVKIIEIGAGAFAGCTDLESVTLPASLKVIGNGAFEGCTALVSVHLPAGINEIGEKAFAGCSALSEVSLKNKNELKTIGAYAFDGCASLGSFILSEKVESVGENAFRGCTAIALYSAYESAPAGWNTAWNPDNITVAWNYIPATDGLVYSLQSKYDSSIRDYVYYYAITGYEGDDADVIIRGDYLGLPVKLIESYAFDENTLVTSVTILDGVTEIGSCAFRRCTNLKTVNMADTITVIGTYAFESTALTEITIGENVTSIGERAFNNCVCLTKVNYNAINATVPTKTSYSGTTATSPFNYISADAPTFTVTVGAKVESIPAYLFYYSNIGSLSFADESVCTSIGNHAFAFSAISQISLPDSITMIGENAFYYASDDLYTVEGGLRYIGNENNPYMVFAGVDDTTVSEVLINDSTKIIATGVYGDLVTSIKIGENVTYICDAAFRGCTNATEVRFNAKNATLGTDVFATINGSRIGQATGFKLIIGSKVEKIPASIFYYAKELKSIEFEDGCIVAEIGDHAFYYCSSLHQLILPDSVTTINNNAFNNCSELYSVTIGTGMTTIADNAFINCNHIHEVINNSSIQIVKGTSTPGGRVALYALVLRTGESSYEEIDGCLFIRQPAVETGDFPSPERYVLIKYVGEGGDVVLPKNVHGLGYYISTSAFYYNTTITSVVIPDGVSSIGRESFKHCTALKSVTIGKDVEYIYTDAFSSCTALESVTIADGTTPLDVHSSAFSGCSALTDFSMPNRVKAIFGDVFKNCASLKYNAYGNLNYLGNSENPYVAIVGVADPSATSITVHEDAKVIYVSSIANMYNLYEIFFNATEMNDLPDGYTVFNGSGSSAGVIMTIPENVKRIPAYLCYMGYGYSFNLTSIVFEGNSKCEYIGSNAFAYTKITTLDLPNTIRDLGIGAFNSCAQLSSVNIPTGLTTVPQAMFSNCSSLASIVIPDGIIEIGQAAFSNCSSLTLVVIPEGVITIGRSAFSDCSKLKEIVIPSTVTTIADFAFYDTTLTTIYFGGTQDQWNAISFGSYSNVYSVTKRYSGQWEMVQGVPTKK